jgi:cyclopropane fatty-acyl-phospholipid synthase-like methyltransferase
MENLQNIEKWNILHSYKRFRPKYPSEHVIRFIFTQFPRNYDKRNELKILDMGCGAGRHTIFLAQEGFKTYACDISEEGTRYLNEELENKKLSATVVKSDMENILFPDDFFDGIISYGVFYYNNSKGYRTAVSEMHRVLKKDGKALVFSRTTDDYRYGKGTKIEKNTFVLDVADTNEKNMKIHFLDHDEIYEMFSKFKNITVEKTETTFANMERKDSDWIIIVEE